MEFSRKWYEEKFRVLFELVGRVAVHQASIIGSVEEERAYLLFHKERFYELLKIISKYATANAKVLDIGTSHLTLLLSEIYKDITTLDSRDGWRNRVEPHGIHFIQHDLLSPPIPLRDDSFDLIVCSEVIEHLPINPAQIFSQIFKLLRKDGVLILTTPNAVSYYHRRDMLFGKNPFQIPPAGPDTTGSWHAREYTLRELEDFSKSAGFKIIEARYPWYWNQPERKTFFSKIKGLALKLIFTFKPSLRDGLLLVLKKT